MDININEEGHRENRRREPVIPAIRRKVHDLEVEVDGEISILRVKVEWLEQKIEELTGDRPLYGARIEKKAMPPGYESNSIQNDSSEQKISNDVNEEPEKVSGANADNEKVVIATAKLPKAKTSLETVEFGSVAPGLDTEVEEDQVIQRSLMANAEPRSRLPQSQLHGLRCRGVKDISFQNAQVLPTTQLNAIEVKHASRRIYRRLAELKEAELCRPKKVAPSEPLHLV